MPTTPYTITFDALGGQIIAKDAEHHPDAKYEATLFADGKVSFYKKTRVGWTECIAVPFVVLQKTVKIFSSAA